MQNFPLQTLEQLPDLLRAFRRQQGLTQAQAAEKLGVTQQVLSSVERDPGKTSVSRLYKLLSVLNVTITLSCPDDAVKPGEPGSTVGSSHAGPASAPSDRDVEW